MEEKLLKMRSAIIEMTQYKKQISDLKEKLSDDEFRLKRKQYSDHTGHIGKEALEARVETTKKVMQELEKRIEACKREITKVAYSIEELEGFNEKLREAKGKAKDNIEKLDERRQKLKNEKKVLKYRQKIEQIDLSNEIASIETQIAEIGQLVKLENAKVEALMPEKERIEAERNTLIDIREIMTNDGNEESNENEEKTVQEYAETDEELRKLLEARNKADMEESYNEMSQSEDGIDRSKEINKARKEKEALDKQIKIKLAEIKGKEKPKGKKTKKSEYTLASLKEAVGKIDEQLIKIKAQKKDKQEQPELKKGPDSDSKQDPKQDNDEPKKNIFKSIKDKIVALGFLIKTFFTGKKRLNPAEREENPKKQLKPNPNPTPAPEKGSEPEPKKDPEKEPEQDPKQDNDESKKNIFKRIKDKIAILGAWWKNKFEGGNEVKLLDSAEKPKEDDQNKYLPKTTGDDTLHKQEEDFKKQLRHKVERGDDGNIKRISHQAIVYEDNNPRVVTMDIDFDKNKGQER